MTLGKQWFQMPGERRFLQGVRKTAPLLREATYLGTSNIQRSDMLDQNHLDFTPSMMQNVTHRHGVR